MSIQPQAIIPNQQDNLDTIYQEFITLNLTAEERDELESFACKKTFGGGGLDGWPMKIARALKCIKVHPEPVRAPERQRRIAWPATPQSQVNVSQLTSLSSLPPEMLWEIAKFLIDDDAKSLSSALEVKTGRVKTVAQLFNVLVFHVLKFIISITSKYKDEAVNKLVVDIVLNLPMFMDEPKVQANRGFPYKVLACRYKPSDKVVLSVETPSKPFLMSFDGNYKTHVDEALKYVNTFGNVNSFGNTLQEHLVINLLELENAKLPLSQYLQKHVTMFDLMNIKNRNFTMKCNVRGNGLAYSTFAKLGQIQGKFDKAVLPNNSSKKLINQSSIPLISPTTQLANDMKYWKEYNNMSEYNLVLQELNAGNTKYKEIYTDIFYEFTRLITERQNQFGTDEKQKGLYFRLILHILSKLHDAIDKANAQPYYIKPYKLVLSVYSHSNETILYKVVVAGKDYVLPMPKIKFEPQDYNIPGGKSKKPAVRFLRSERKHVDQKTGALRTIYTKNGKTYVKRKDPMTGRFKYHIVKS